MAGRRDLYVGKGGQMAAMAEFLLLGYNVAVPEVDVGDDVLVIEDRRGGTYRVQVKTSRVRWLKDRSGYSVRFQVPIEQLRRPITPELYYVFSARIGSGHWEFLIVSRLHLERLCREEGVGSQHGTRISLLLTFRRDRVDGYAHNFQEYRNNWSRYWPTIEH